MTGSKTEHERGVKLIREFHDLLRGEDPALDSEDRFRQRWGTTGDAQAGQQAMLAMPGVAGFVLDDETGTPTRIPNPTETPLEQARQEMHDIERQAGLDPDR